MELNENIERSLGLLHKILIESIASKDDGNMQTSFVYRHASNIFHLGEDTICLLQSGRSYSCPIVVRSMLESLFKLVAAIKAPDTAVQIIINELEEDCDKIAKFPKWLDPAVYVPIAEDFSNQIKHFRKGYGITSTKKWTTLACAEAAELDGHYRDAYFHFSSHTHAKIIGMDIQEKSAGYCLQMLIFCVLTAALHLAHIAHTNSPQEHIGGCEKLGDEWIRLMEAGVFSKMDQA